MAISADPHGALPGGAGPHDSQYQPRRLRQPHDDLEVGQHRLMFTPRNPEERGTLLGLAAGLRNGTLISAPFTVDSITPICPMM